MLRQASLTLQGATIKSVIIIKASSCVIVVKAEDSSPIGIGFKTSNPPLRRLFSRNMYLNFVPKAWRKNE
jgi:hypothetical protein